MISVPKPLLSDLDYFNTIHAKHIYLGVELDNLMETSKPLTFKVVTVNEVPVLPIG